MSSRMPRITAEPAIGPSRVHSDGRTLARVGKAPVGHRALDLPRGATATAAANRAALRREVRKALTTAYELMRSSLRLDALNVAQPLSDIENDLWRIDERLGAAELRPEDIKPIVRLESDVVRLEAALRAGRSGAVVRAAGAPRIAALEHTIRRLVRSLRALTLHEVRPGAAAHHRLPRVVARAVFIVRRGLVRAALALRYQFSRLAYSARQMTSRVIASRAALALGTGAAGRAPTPRAAVAGLTGVGALAAGAVALVGRSAPSQIASSALLASGAASAAALTQSRQLLPARVWGAACLSAPFLFGYWKREPAATAAHVLLGVASLIASARVVQTAPSRPSQGANGLVTRARLAGAL